MPSSPSSFAARIRSEGLAANAVERSTGYSTFASASSSNSRRFSNGKSITLLPRRIRTSNTLELESCARLAVLDRVERDAPDLIDGDDFAVNQRIRWKRYARTRDFSEPRRVRVAAT